MAGKVGESSSDLKVDLLKEGYEFSFFQVLRLLRLFSRKQKGRDEEPGDEDKNIRIRPELSLRFPASDVAKVEELTTDDPSFLVTATILGLYGTSSPLPTFYTEDLIDDAREDLSATRDFIDFLNHRLYILFYECWAKYRLFLKVTEERHPDDLERLFCLLGLGEKELREEISNPYSLLRYIGLFTQFPRSALGLETLIKDVFCGKTVEVIPCIKRRVKIPPDQRFYLGVTESALGENTYLGEEIDDRMGKFRLRIGPLDNESFHSLLPGNPDHHRLAFLTRFYLLDPLEYDIELVLREREAETACLGGPAWSRLGLDTWAFSRDYLGQVEAIFPPQMS